MAMSEEEEKEYDKTMLQLLGMSVGGHGGALAGGKAGAVVGTMIAGPAGTMVGGMVGAAIGGTTGLVVGAQNPAAGLLALIGVAGDAGPAVDKK